MGWHPCCKCGCEDWHEHVAPEGCDQCNQDIKFYHYNNITLIHPDREPLK